MSRGRGGVEMPIYEYGAIGKGCEYCREVFEVRQSIDDEPLSRCPICQATVRKLVSKFHACVVEDSDEAIVTEKKICEYEQEGRWSHAAELADKSGLEDRAREDYREWRDALLSGYLETAPTPADQLVHLDSFIAARCASAMVWAHSRARDNPRFREHLHEWSDWSVGFLKTCGIG